MPARIDQSEPILVNVGDTFMIVVESNPSTGYHWEIIGDLSGVELVSREYTEGTVIPGSGGVEVWIFKAVSSGETLVTLGSFPPDANVTEPEQTTTFMVTIE